VDITEAIVSLGKRVREQQGVVDTEEATKNAFIMPFISQVLGYDVFNPFEVVPEYIADVGIKKGEKIDYAIIKDGVVQILIECKKIGFDLSVSSASQLFRYFAVSEAKIAVLTNGRIYEFYSDLDASNIMDSKPFLRVDILDVPSRSISHLKKMRKESFDLDGVLTTARRLKYIAEMKQVLLSELRTPSEDFVRLVTKRVYSKLLTAKVLEEFGGFLSEAAAQLLDDEASGRLRKALQEDDVTDVEKVEEPVPPAVDEPAKARAVVETTPEELEAFGMIKSYCFPALPGSRLCYRDALSYMAIMVDDNNRKTIARLYFNNPDRKRIGIFQVGEDGSKTETMHDLPSINDLQSLSEELRQAAQAYV